MNFKIQFMRLLIALFLIASMTLSSCVQKKKEPVKPIDTNTLMHQVTVNEIIQTDSYTYLRVEENGKEFWMAVNSQKVSEGDKYYYDSPLEMKNFNSKALDRTFETIFFVQNFSTEPIKATTSNPMAGKTSPQGKAIEDYNSDIDIQPVDGGLTIAQLYESKADYSNKTVKVKGKVVKVNLNIMGRNWLHIQDGTKFGESYDLTFTSDETAQVGDVIIVEGVVVLDKDFGAGYFYELILERGKIIK